MQTVLTILEDFVGHSMQESLYCQVRILISVICKAYNATIHKQFMNRNQQEITYFLSTSTVCSVCQKVGGEYLVSLVQKLQVISYLKCICYVIALKYNILCT